MGFQTSWLVSFSALRFAYIPPPLRRARPVREALGGQSNTPLSDDSGQITLSRSIYLNAVNYALEIYPLHPGIGVKLFRHSPYLKEKPIKNQKNSKCIYPYLKRLYIF